MGTTDESGGVGADTGCGGHVALGRRGEALVAAALRARGWRIRARNWRGADGELDVVAEDPQGTLVVLEIKTRAGEAGGAPEEAVTPAKVLRLRSLAAQWLAQAADETFGRVRIDVVAVYAPPNGRPTFTHFTGVGE